MGVTDYIKRKLGIMEADGRIKRQPKSKTGKKKRPTKLHYRVQPAIEVDLSAPSKPLTPDEQPRSDGKPSCQSCKHNKFATVKKNHIYKDTPAKIIKCRFCNTRYITVDGDIIVKL